MIVLTLIGGIGNQMFQYACAKSLALDTGQKLYLDFSMTKSYHDQNIKNSPLRVNSELDLFNLKINTISSERLMKFRPRAFPIESKLISIKYKIIQYFYNTQIYTDRGYAQSYKDITKLQKSKDLLLYGYFQNEKYFNNNEHQIKKDFVYKPLLSEYGREILKRIKKSKCAVSIHVRRGDLVSNKEAAKHHGLCSLEYYKEAIQRINSLTSSKNTFFLFSDDLEWVNKHFKGLISDYVLVNNKQKIHDSEEMILMSLCNHNIIANSSFSWWGGWLNQTEDKIIISPKEWIMDRQKNIQAIKIIPDNWIKI
jgi:hypothetical protein